MALLPVRPGEIATIVTTLEMTRRPLPRPIPPSPLRLVRWPAPRLDSYRTLFRRVGAPWLWFSRLVMEDSALAAIIEDERIEIFAVTDRQGIEVGMLELDFRENHACELSFFAMVPEMTGKGHGRWLMANALSLGWRNGIDRLWVHTCTLDHPRALGFYRSSGFTAFKQTIETFSDPRLTGHLPLDCADHIPLFDPDSRR
mgnify:CR=1 FL=1